MYGRNSTIRTKEGNCEICGKSGPLTKKRCQSCYWSNIRMKSVIKQQAKEVDQDESLQNLIADLDIIFSRYIRLKDADLYGKVACISCGKKEKWTMMDCGHFIPREHMYTRFSELNCAPQCQHCNRYMRGNLSAYAKALELIRPGTVEMLWEQSRTIYKFDYSELKLMISNYSRKLKQLK